jgi:pSer/pThr/pTyr-binding forkhead associated (FHA) protein
MAELIVQSGKHQGKRLLVPARDLVVGRDEDCDLRIGSNLVSRKHCVLRATPEGILVTDLGSQNGTHVNDVQIVAATLLHDGDVLRIGSTIFAVPSTGRAKPSESSVTDAEIADWLTDSGSNFSGGDTAVFSTYNPANPGQTTAEPAPVTPQPAKPAPAVAPAQAAPKPAPRVLSVKEEAAAVIRKHWETVKAKKN